MVRTPLGIIGETNKTKGTRRKRRDKNEYVIKIDYARCVFTYYLILHGHVTTMVIGFCVVVVCWSYNEIDGVPENWPGARHMVIKLMLPVYMRGEFILCFG